jgi:hypothetical protein
MVGCDQFLICLLKVREEWKVGQSTNFVWVSILTSRDVLIFGDPFSFQFQFLVMVFIVQIVWLLLQCSTTSGVCVCKCKDKESCNRPGVAQRVPGGLGSQIFMTFST